MPLPVVNTMIGVIATLLQLAATALIVIAFLVLGALDRRMRAVRVWSGAWIALLVGLVAVSINAVAGYVNLAAGVPLDAGREIVDPAARRLLYIAYLGAKLAFFGFLLAGVEVALGRSLRRPHRAVLALAGGLTVVTLVAALVAKSVFTLLSLQGFVAVPVYAIAAWRVATAPRPSGRLGATLLATALGVHALLWLAYIPFNLHARPVPAYGDPWAILLHLAIRGPFIDALMALALAVSMVIHGVEETLVAAEQERHRLAAERAQAQRLEAVGRLVSGIAHELNNPLAAILGYSQQLLLDPRDAGDREALGTIEHEASRARRIVQDLLGFVRRRELRPAPLDPVPVAIATARGLAHEAERRQVQVLVSAPGTPLAVTADAAAFEQVLANLVRNAIQVTPPGGAVQVRFTGEPAEVAIAVEDDGPGIAAEVLPRIFEPFFTTKAEGEGTGLGLSVSLGLVEQQGGRLTAANRADGRGAVFEVVLPRAEPVDATAPAGVLTLPPPPVPMPTPLESDAPTVLIIDDEPGLRGVLRRYFARLGWRVVEMDGGLAARAWLADDAAHTPDLILCDIRMPDVSGTDLQAWLVEHRPALESRLVFCTGDVASPTVAAFLDRTARPVLQKPFALDEVDAVIRRVHGADVAAR